MRKRHFLSVFFYFEEIRKTPKIMTIRVSKIRKLWYNRFTIVIILKEVALDKSTNITTAQRWILSEIKKNKKMTLKELMKITEIKESTLRIYLSRLVQLGLIVYIRVSGQETVYTIKKGKK